MTPRCPKCRGTKVRPNGERLYLCIHCDMLFDDSPDDGVTTYGDPARIAERNERHEQNRRSKAGRMKVSTDFSRFKQSNLRGGLGR